MSNDKNGYVKVLFRYHSNILDETIVETMWAKTINEKIGLYKLDSIPFYGPPIATDDEFLAEYDKSEEMLTFKGVTKYSENSIIVITILNNKISKEPIREEFKLLNCLSEGLNDSYFAMEVLCNVDYLPIKDLLDKYENKGILSYAEPSLSDKHRTDIEK